MPSIKVKYMLGQKVEDLDAADRFFCTEDRPNTDERIVNIYEDAEKPRDVLNRFTNFLYKLPESLQQKTYGAQMNLNDAVKADQIYTSLKAAIANKNISPNDPLEEVCGEVISEITGTLEREGHVEALAEMCPLVPHPDILDKKAPLSADEIKLLEDFACAAKVSFNAMAYYICEPAAQFDSELEQLANKFGYAAVASCLPENSKDYTSSGPVGARLVKCQKALITI